MSRGFGAGDQSREIACPLCGESILNQDRATHLREDCTGGLDVGR